MSALKKVATKGRMDRRSDVFASFALQLVVPESGDGDAGGGWTAPLEPGMMRR